MSDHQQEQDAGAMLKAGIDKLNLGLMDDVAFQATRKELAAGLGCTVPFLTKTRKNARAARLKALNATKPAQTKSDPWQDAPFLPLGIRGTDAVLFCRATKQVIIGSGRHFFLYAGGFDFFHGIAPGGKEGDRIDWDRAESEVIDRAKKGGMFDTSGVRPRGAWLEQEKGETRLVLNLGDRLLVNGESQPLGPRAGHIYTAGVALKVPETLPPPLSIQGAGPIHALCRALRWRYPAIEPSLLIGFIVVAQVGGALSWRPNVWLTSRSQAGKTTLRDRAIRPLTPFFYGSFGVDSTAAGIRQKLAGDSLPWSFDESEADTVTGQSQIKAVLRLLRGSTSSIDNEFSVKGTTTGRALTFGLRSSVLLSSVLVASESAADISRVTPIELIASSEDEFRRKIDPLYSSITPHLGLQLFSRIVGRWTDLFHYIELFRPRVTSRVRSLRGGDQLGTLLAGAFFVEHDGPATGDDVDRWLDGIKDWGEHAHGYRASTGDETDEQRCLGAILGAQVDVTLDGVRSVRDKRTVAELVDVARTGKSADGVDLNCANALLPRFGIRVETEGDDQRIWVANRNDALVKVLNGQFTAPAIRALLARLPGATKNKPKKFAGLLSRAISIPATLLDDDAPEAEIDRLAEADAQ